MKTKAVQGADLGGVEQGQLLGQMERRRTRLFQCRLGGFQALAQTLPHFRRGGKGERHHQNLVDGPRIGFIKQPRQATIHHGLGLARAAPATTKTLPRADIARCCCDVGEGELTVFRSCFHRAQCGAKGWVSPRAKFEMAQKKCFKTGAIQRDFLDRMDVMGGWTWWTRCGRWTPMNRGLMRARPRHRSACIFFLPGIP